MVAERIGGECQHAIVEGVQILDAALTTRRGGSLNEKRAEGMICKPNTEKYNTVSWSFFLSMMYRIGFGTK